MNNRRDDFPILQRQVDGRPLVYLDSAATSLRPRQVIDAVTAFYTQHTANVHRAVHLLSEEATQRFEATRGKLARLINADEHEIVFTRGSTDAINLVRRCVPNLKRTITTLMEHHSNLLPWGYGDNAHVVPVDAQGQIDWADLDEALARGADLVAVTHVSNALGAIAPVERIISKAHAAGALVLLDGAQSVPHLPIDVKALDVDFLAFSAHKMLGPGGVGALFGKMEHLQTMSPHQLGGHIVDQVHADHYTLQEPPHRFEAGTPAIEAVIGWGAAVDYLADVSLDAIEAHDRELVAYAIERLSTMKAVKIVGPTDPAQRCASVSFTVEGLEAHGVARMLSNRANVMVRSGFHCAQPLHEALAMLPTVRASFYLYNTRADVDALIEGLQAIVRFL